MARLPRSPIAQDVQNNYTPVREARMDPSDPVGRSLEQAGGVVHEIGVRLADSKIVADAADASIRLRSRLDEEYRLIENDTVGDPAGLESRFRMRASQVVNEEASRMQSPALKRAFGQRAAESVETYSISMRDVTRRRRVEVAKADTIRVGTAYEDLAADVSKSPELVKQSRDDYLALIERQHRLGIYSQDQAEQLRIGAQKTYEQAISDRHLLNVDDLIDQGRYGEARAHFDSIDHEILPAVRQKAKAAMDAATREGAAIQKADQFWDESEGNWNRFLEKTRAIENPQERLAVEARGATLKNQDEAGRDAEQRDVRERGLMALTSGQRVPADVWRDADGFTRDFLQEQQRQRDVWNQQMATLSAQERQAMAEMSRHNAYMFEALAETNSGLFQEGAVGWVSQPFLAEMYETLSPTEKGRLEMLAARARKGGDTADAGMRMFQDVVAMLPLYAPEGLSAKDLLVGQGQMGMRDTIRGTKKSELAIKAEGILLRLTAEEARRTAGRPIGETRAEQLIAMAYAEASDRGAPSGGFLGIGAHSGGPRIPIDPELRAGITEVEAQRAEEDWRREQSRIRVEGQVAIDRFRRENPLLWSEAARIARARNPGATEMDIMRESVVLRSMQVGSTLSGFVENRE